jgi:hypothetical protein
MEGADSLSVDLEAGDVVTAVLEGTRPGDDNLYQDMYLTQVVVSDNGVYLVDYTPFFYDSNLIDEFEYAVVYRYRMRLGDAFLYNPSEGVLVSTITGQPVETERKKPCITGNLVGLRNGRLSDISAKYEAYQDPCVAALSETPGRITRNRYYAPMVNKI